MTLQITGTTVINSGCCLVNIANASTGITSNTYVIRNSDGSICFNNIFAEGCPTSGGYLICKNGGTAWIVAPISSEVSRVWANIADANTRAQQVSGCTGWFVPTCAQLQNPGYTCRTYWDSYSSAYYWSSTEFSATGAWTVDFITGSTSSIGPKINTFCVRAFRCVTY